MATGKAANGRSSIYADATGWHGWVSLGTDPLTGQRRRRHLRGSTRREVVKQVQKLESQRESGDLDVAGADVTLEVWLGHWLSGVHRTRRSQTYNRCEWAVRLYLIPTLGERRLDKLTSTLIERSLSCLTRTLRDGTVVNASDSTRREVLNVLVNALNEAVKQNRLRRNPCTGVRLARPEPTEIQPLDRDEVAAVIAVVEKRRNGGRWLLALALGLRQSEVLGLRWSDVDLDSQVLTVRKQLARLSWSHGCADPGTCGPASKCVARVRRDRDAEPKTRASRRVLYLDDPLVHALKAHRRGQFRERLQAGNLWVDGDWVFANHTGGPLEHRNDLREWKTVLEKSGLASSRIHDLRHTNATMLLLGGVSTRVVMELMGWTTTSMASRYQHVVPELNQQAARSIGTMMFGRGADQIEVT